ncbi:multidrug effflux MFS transporter [Roseobacter sp. HKCCA0434]|uniref:multidrug effflux MFS transporter n=1 Tax=Roseobacter sp. HKCCA0434 TaxID=3079297 RepID=UPI00290586C7|nr:multidrug effflux MFS transporter [Roseobacter sp. HKCCA0434]
MAHVTQSHPVEAPGGGRRWLDRTTPPHIVTLVLIAGIGALNMNIFLPSLPGMAEWFQADYAVVQLAISAYLGVTALLQLVIGPLSDRYGRRVVMLWAMGVFTLATLGCLLSPTIGWFLAFRFVQAVVASGMVLSRAVVRDMVGPDRAASMIGYVTMGMALVPMIGPLIGGQLEAMFGWHGSVALLVVAGLAVWWLVWADMGETNAAQSSGFAEQFRAYPELLTAPRFWGYALTAAFASGAFFAFLGGGPNVASVTLDLSPRALGAYFGFIAGGYMLGNFLSGRFSAQMGLNRMMLAGAATASSGLIVAVALFGSGLDHPMSLFGPLFFVGVGNGLTLPSANAGMVSVRPHLAGSASGLGGALMIGGGAALAAITGAMPVERFGVWPLLIAMLSAAVLSGLCTLFVMYRVRKTRVEA